MAIDIIEYTNEWEKQWDEFVMNNSVNGTFLQTRKFLNYHPKGRFKDASLIAIQGSNIVAVIPGCVSDDSGERCFFSHKGSTFGGIVIGKAKYNITTLEEIFPKFEAYLVKNEFKTVYMKSTSDVFAKERSELLDYYYYKSNFELIEELSFYVDCETMPDDIISAWSSGRRRDYRYSLNNDLSFRELTTDEDLDAFYKILKDNLARHDARPVHTLNELKEFRDVRFPDIVNFYGVLYKDEIIAGTMLFNFQNEVLHSQYLAQNADYANLYTMNFLNYNVIKLAKENGFKKFSFGISTEDQGKFLNIGLAVFKEGFGAKFCNNRSYKKSYSNEIEG